MRGSEFRRRLTTATATIAVLAVSAAPAFGADTIEEAFAEGDVIFDARARWEHVDQDGFAEEADALTLRTRLGFETGEFRNIKVLLEFENVIDLVADYNSTTNGRTIFPVIADPETTEVNRAQIAFSGLPDTNIVLGRQRVILNNARFIGNVGFRQNEQTFDALVVSNSSLGPVALTYAYIDRAHRIFGDDHPLGEIDSNSHALQGDVELPFGDLSAYGLFLDLEEVPALSTATYGARLTGSAPLTDVLDFNYVAEYAHQSDYADNPFDVGLGYWHGEAGLAHAPFSAALGVEVLEGDGALGFSTPLATLHKFQGFADAFLTTPADGIRDIYARAAFAWAEPPVGDRATFALIYHDFASESGGLDFGSEIDGVATLVINEHASLQLKAALFNGDTAGPADRDKFWLAVTTTY